MGRTNLSSEIKILELWQKPPESGDPLGCLATSFTFDSAEFEEECLSRYLNLASDGKTESTIHLMELETRLLEMNMPTVFVDAFNAHGKRSPRWSIAPVKVKGGVFHPKVQLLVWSKAIRIIIGSANLSENGLRSNTELVFHVDFHNEAEANKDFALDVLAFFSSINSEARLSPDNKEKVQKLIENARTLIRSFTLQEPAIHYEFMGVQPSKESIFTKIEKLSQGVVFDSVTIESPSFDQPGTTNEAADEIWRLLRQRGIAEVTYNLAGTKTINGRYEIFAPKELLKTEKNNQKVNIRLYEGILGEESRPLHSKCYHFKNDRYSLVIIGSSNFSQLGLGLKKKGFANFEANIAFWIDRNKVKKADHFIEGLFVESIEIDPENALWLPEKVFDPANEALAMPFPHFIKFIDFKKDNDLLYYEIGLNPDAPKFKVQSEDLAIDASFETSQTEIVRIDCKNVLPLNELKILWEVYGYLYPVSIVSQDSIPSPDYLKNLSLEEITRLLSSNLSLHKALQVLLRKKVADEKKEMLHYDPHALVDTSQFILKRTRQFSWAMAALKHHIERPTSCREQLHWRIHGPVGLFAVKDAVLKFFSNNHEERSFFIAEVLGEVHRYNIPSCKTLRPEEIKEELNLAIEEIKKELSLHLNLASPNLKKYIKTIEKTYALKV